MSSALKSNRLASVKVRLTLLSGAIIACSTLAAYALMYGSLSRALQSNVDHYLRSELSEFESIYSKGGIHELREEIRLEEFAQGSSHIFMRVLDATGKEVLTSDCSHWGAATDWKGPLPPPGPPNFRTIAAEPDAMPGRRIEGHIGADAFVIMGVETEQHRVVLATFRERFWEVFVLLLGVSLLGAWLIARRAMRGVEMLTITAEEIAGGALDRRITGQGFGYEIDRLASVFNRMIDKIAALITEARTLNDNIAHELRSPLTRIRGAAEVAATSDTTSRDCRELAAGVVEECDGVLNIVNSMLAISQMESGLAKVEANPVDCVRLVQDTCDFFQPLAEDRKISLEAAISEGATVRGDSARLHQVVANLIDNALKYTAAGGNVTVSLARRNGSAVISVRDSGVGIAKNDLPHIFERFYRSENVRATSGNGLGLGLVHAIVYAHGGTVDVSSALGTGTTFNVYLPLE